MLKIKEIRLKKNLTQDELCNLSGINKRSLLDYESGKTDIPFSKLHNIAIALNVNIYDLIENEENNILNEPVEEYSSTNNGLLENQLSILKETLKMKDEIIDMQKIIIATTKDKLEDCEQEKKHNKTIK